MSKKHFKYLSAQGNVTVKGPGVRLHRVIVGTGEALSTITIYDSEDTTGPVVALIDASTELSLNFGGVYLSDMHVVMGTADSDVTIVYE